MKRIMFCAAAVLMVLPGCASNGNSRYAAEKKFVVDQDYVDAVNEASRRNGVRVTWVNPPTRRAPIDGDTSN
ncbi:MAG TPA: hypothetical protein PLR28_10510 [Dokdonella sp.]|uniref:hypothetical protein n=1 Tax=Dokdonella sp. TaxID=2291710 RepID=UPI002CF6CB89|nr:hypothetical protein [Dokdonella sp.]HPG94974.1 hypothetical protein [Dokdonella sp.]HPN80147.1 hypothetical protein [Dokdonella sp.]